MREALTLSEYHVQYLLLLYGLFSQISGER